MATWSYNISSMDGNLVTLEILSYSNVTELADHFRFERLLYASYTVVLAIKP